MPTETLLDPRKVVRFLEEAGVSVPDSRRATLEGLLDDPDVPDDIRNVILARTSTATNTDRKVGAALAAIDADARLRNTLVYGAAHTGRWSGRGFQPQNLPHGLEVPLDQIIADVLAGKAKALGAHAKRLKLLDTATLLRGLVRAIIVAPAGRELVQADYAQVEPRILRWLVSDDATLHRFENPKWDLYADLAGRLLGSPATAITSDDRRLGKVGEPGCGYGMGAERTGLYGEALGIDWSKAPLTPQKVVYGWRDENPLIAGKDGLWQQVEGVFALAADGVPYQHGRIPVDHDGRDVLMELPSGRRLRYRNARVEADSDQRRLSYERRGRRIRTWGAKLVENIVQAIGRDLLAHALVRLEESGFPAVLHVHDEVVIEAADAADARLIEEIMSEPPAWARGLPLAVTTTAGPRYT